MVRQSKTSRFVINQHAVLMFILRTLLLFNPFFK
jgi:hypothetical protein